MTETLWSIKPKVTYCLGLYRKKKKYTNSWNRRLNTKASEKYSSKWANNIEEWTFNVFVCAGAGVAL